MGDDGRHAGIDEERVGSWLASHLRDSTPPFRFRLITGGRSNLTFEVTDAAGERTVLRRPPLGHLLPTAHDVLREHRIISALAGTGVPVPPALAACDDEAVNGAPFFVTRFVDGVVLDAAEKAAPLVTTTRTDLSHSLIDVLAELHAVDLERVGLADLSKREGYLERQIRRWTRQWEGSRTRDLLLIDAVATGLQREMPPQRGVTIVHGDYRFGNCISDFDRCTIAAVLDWELCTLGDPLADLGHLAVYWYDASLRLPLTNDPTSGGGFPPFDDLLERYAKKSGRDVTDISYYRAFAAWRLAVIAEGVAWRYREHHPDDAAALSASQAAVEGLAQFAMQSLG